EEELPSDGQVAGRGAFDRDGLAVEGAGGVHALAVARVVAAVGVLPTVVARRGIVAVVATVLLRRASAAASLATGLVLRVVIVTASGDKPHRKKENSQTLSHRVCLQKKGTTRAQPGTF